MKCKMFSMLLFLIISFSLLNNKNAYADCDYRLETSAIVYKVSDNNSPSQSNITISRDGRNDPLCSNFFLAFPAGWYGNYNRRAYNLLNGKSIYYNIYKNSNSTGILKGANDISSPDETFFGTINNHQSNTYTYYMAIAPFGVKPPTAGIYLDDAPVQAYSGTYNGIKHFENFRNMFVVVLVPKFTSISMVDSGGTYDSARTSKTLDFGELNTGVELGFDVRVVSNSGYRLKISSFNNGQLKKIGGHELTSQIGYSFYANGNKINLGRSSSSAVTIASGSGVTSSQGARIPIRVVIGTVDSSKSPGTYQDYLTLTTISTD